MIDPTALSGLELLLASAAGQLPRASMSETMGMTGLTAEKGRIVIRARADKRHLNPLGGVHGGFAASILDSATGSAVHTMLDPGVGYGTIDLAVKMLRPVPVGEEVVADATVVHMSRSLGVAEGKLLDAAGHLLATAYATCFIKPMRS